MFKPTFLETKLWQNKFLYHFGNLCPSVHIRQSLIQKNVFEEVFDLQKLTMKQVIKVLQGFVLCFFVVVSLFKDKSFKKITFCQQSE